MRNNWILLNPYRSVSLTPCFSGVLPNIERVNNRFNGLPQRVKTVETVIGLRRLLHTPLKQGVNGARPSRHRVRLEASGNNCRTVLTLLLWICLYTISIPACRYNVRDVGFVDLGVEPYILY